MSWLTSGSEKHIGTVTYFNLVCNFFISLKSHREFHEDLFPDTVAREASMTADEWFGGANNPVSCDISFHLFFVTGTLFVGESFSFLQLYMQMKQCGTYINLWYQNQRFGCQDYFDVSYSKPRKLCYFAVAVVYTHKISICLKPIESFWSKWYPQCCIRWC